MIRPRPPHELHGRLKEKKPWSSSTAPRPPHCGQAFGAVPGAAPLPTQSGQRTSEVMFTVVVAPWIESSKDRCRSDSMSGPRRGPVGGGF